MSNWLHEVVFVFLSVLYDAVHHGDVDDDDLCAMCVWFSGKIHGCLQVRKNTHKLKTG